MSPLIGGHNRSLGHLGCGNWLLVAVSWLVAVSLLALAKQQQQHESDGAGRTNRHYKKDDRLITNANEVMTYSVPLSDSGGKVVVLDRVFTKEDVEQMEAWLTSTKTGWLFSGLDRSENESLPFAPPNKAPWRAMMSAEGFAKTAPWKQVQALLNDLYPRGSVDDGAGDLRLASVSGYVLRRGDHVEPDGGEEAADQTSLIAQVYLQAWKTTYGGETLVLNASQSIAAAVNPQLGRVAIFPAAAARHMRPPTMDYDSTQQILELHLTRSQQDFDNGHALERAFLQEIRTRLRTEQSIFTDTFQRTKDTRDSGRDPADYLVKSFTAQNGKRLAVFDGYLDEAHVVALRNHIMRGTVYQFDKSQSGSDNVKWIAGFESRAFTRSWLYDELQKIVNEFTGRVTYHPHDVTCNLIRHADNTWIHEDCDYGQPDVTLLVYLNPNWTRSMCGETVFFEDVGSGAGTESVAAIRPRFGRIAIFDGLFKHSARPPCPVFQGARYTFAVKYSITESLADDEHPEETNEVPNQDELAEMADEMLTDLQGVPDGDKKATAVAAAKDLRKRAESGKRMTHSEIKEIMEGVDKVLKELGFGDDYE